MTRTVLSLAFIVVAASTASAQVRHVPPAEAVAGETFELAVEAPAATPTLAAELRTVGSPQWTSVELVRRDGNTWVAVVPAALIAEPGIEYYLVAGGTPVFASPEWPHGLAVRAPADADRRERDLLRVHGRRSRLHTLGEWVDYGSRRNPVPGGPRLADRFYRLDAEFAYRLYTYPLEEIRVGYTRLIGDTQSNVDPSMTEAAGFKVGGWVELGLAAVEGVHFDGRVIAMATQEGFAVGGRAEARLGDRQSGHIAAGVEYLADVGTSGFFRLGWGTVPGLPMAATVEVTNMPASYRATGIRLYYDIAREVAAGFRLGVRVGYAARNQTVAGFTGGLGATVEF